MSELFRTLAALGALLLLGEPSLAEKPHLCSLAGWHSTYKDAQVQAEREGKMLLIFFHDPKRSWPSQYQQAILADSRLSEALSRYVCARLPLDAAIRTPEGKQLPLMKHEAFRPMRAKSGLAILDYSDPSSEHFGCLVSAYPLTAGIPVPLEQLQIILDLPSGSAQERSAIYAQRLREHIQRHVATRPRLIDRFRRRIFNSDRPEMLANTFWHTNYARASRVAEQQGKMLLIYFQDPQITEQRNRFETETLGDATVQQRLKGYVCLKLPLYAEACIDGRSMPLLKHAAFEHMLAGAGVAIVDWANKDEAYYGCVVSEFPLFAKHWYTPERMAVILDLPPASLTQRTMIYAVRVHPERPASTQGQLDFNLLQEAESHSGHQAAIRLQGHHQWDTRFRRISAQLPMGLLAAEVCAESWPGEHLVEAAVECVRCWRLSSGHWSAVRAYHPLYGYDMKRGANGIWYATGIFGEGARTAFRSRPG